MTKLEETLKFLELNGLKATAHEEGHSVFIDEIIDIATGEKLNDKSANFFGESLLTNLFKSNDGSVVVEKFASKITISKPGVNIVLDGDGKQRSLNIHDTSTHDDLEIKYKEEFRLKPNDLGEIAICLDSKTFDCPHRYYLTQSAFGANLENEEKVIKLENENAEMYTQALLSCIKKENVVSANSEIQAKLPLVVTYIQDMVAKLIDIKYERTDELIQCLEMAKTELNNKIAQIQTQVDVFDDTISQIKTSGKKM